MSRVVDASVAIKWFVIEPWHDRAEALLDDSEPLHAPDLLIAEVANILWKKSMRGEVEPGQAMAIIATLGQDVPLLHDSAALKARALELAITLRHPAYDGFYLACAEAVGGVVITADRRLRDAAVNGGYGSLIQYLPDM